MSDELIQFGYLVAAVLFILGIRGLARPRTAVRGNQLGSLGMLVAVVVTLTDNDIIGYGAIVGGLVVGTAIGVLLATRVQMTGMPQLVALRRCSSLPPDSSRCSTSSNPILRRRSPPLRRLQSVASRSLAASWRSPNCRSSSEAAR